MSASVKSQEDIISPSTFTNPQYDFMQECSTDSTVWNDSYNQNYYGLCYQSGIWDQMNDTFAGSRTVKKKGTVYLPLSPGQAVEKGAKRTELYRWYLFNASFPHVVSKFVGDMQGMLFATPTEYTLDSDSLDRIKDNATMQGDSLDQVELDISTNQTVSGRIGILCVPDVSTKGLVSPKLLQYPDKTILNWETITDYLIDKEQQHPGFWEEYRDDNKTFYGAKWVLLDESKTVQGGTVCNRYRILGLDRDGKYYNLITDNMMYFDSDLPWECLGCNQGEAVESRKLVYPNIGGNEINFIPFTVINSTNVGFDCYNPVMLPVSEMALDIYNVKALLKQSVQVASQPVLAIIGADPADISSELVVGGTKAIIINNKDGNGSVSYAETSGNGVETLMKIINDLKSELQDFSVDLVANASESGVALNIRITAKTSSLKTLALTRQAGMKDILVNSLLMMKPEMTREQANEQITVKCNTDFKPEGIDATQLQIFDTMHDKGKLNDEDIHYILNKMDVRVKEDFDEWKLQQEKDMMSKIPVNDFQNVEDNENDIEG